MRLPRLHRAAGRFAVAAAVSAVAGCGASNQAPPSGATTAGAGGAAGAGHSAGLRASARIGCRRRPAGGPAPAGARFTRVALPAQPDGVAVTPDGRTAFVALQGAPAQIAVLDLTGGTPRLRRTIPVPATASGLSVTPDDRYLLGAAGRGVDVVDVAAAVAGRPGAAAGLLQAPVAVAGRGPGAAEVTSSADSRIAFVTLEGSGRVAVFSLPTGGFRGSVAVGAGALGIAASPGSRRRLYVVSESGRAPGTHRHGVLSVLDAARAITDPGRAILAQAAAPCAPVRVAATGRRVWVTARDGNAVLGFSAAALAHDPARALASVTPVGAAPLGLGVAGERAVVADSDLTGRAGTREAVSLLELGPGAPAVVGTVHRMRQPDAVALVPTRGATATALITDAVGRQLLALRLGPAAATGGP